MKSIFFYLAAFAFLTPAQNYTVYSGTGLPIARTSFLRSQEPSTKYNVLGDSSLVLYLPLTQASALNATFPDLSGNGYIASMAALSGSVTINTGVPSGYLSGKISSQGAYFNHSNRNAVYVYPSSSTINAGTGANVGVAVGNPTTGAFTVSAWVAVNSPSYATGNGYDRVMENYYSSGFFLGTNATNTAWLFIVANSGANGCSGGTLATGSQQPWAMVTGVWNGTNEVLYVNGTQAASCSITPTTSLTGVTQSSLTFAVGGCSYSHNGSGGLCTTVSPYYQWFDGKIQGVRVYNRALAAAEIAAIYTAENH